jgi:RNA polymerase sigma-B factor
MPDDKLGLFASLSNERLIELLRGELAKGNDLSRASQLREELVKRNIGLVRSIASRFLNSGESLDDLVQAGYIGLLNAASNFDLARNIRFATYASYLIRGEIRHYIRDKHSTVRIPQWLQAMGQKLKETEEAFFQEQGRSPSVSELALQMKLTKEQVIEVLRGRGAITYVSIDKQRRKEDPQPSVPGIEDICGQGADLSCDVQVRIAVAIEKLEKLQQQVVQGLFYQGKTQVEMGRELNISQRQVSRTKQEALRKLKREVLGENEK